MKFNIGKKIFMGNLPLIMVILLITFVTLYRISEANTLFTHVLDVEIRQKDAAEKMIEVLRDRESKVMRYLILQSEDMQELMNQRDQEYGLLLDSIIPLLDSLQFVPLQSENEMYQKALGFCIGKVTQSGSAEFKKADSIRIQAYQNQGTLLQDIVSQASAKQKSSTESAVKIISQTFWVITTVAASGLFMALLMSWLVGSILLRSVRKLEKAATLVSEGEFRDLPTVESSDELGELSRSFNNMANRLIILEETYKDASPLTRLPGGLAVETVVQSRIDQEIPFAFCMLDLDNFKPFNDRYGYSRGNMVIKHTAEIAMTTTLHLGSEYDFVGHIGGDDFVVITEPERLNIICSSIISRFDHDIVQFYDEEDIKNRSIVSKTRKGVTQEFPIMTISISAVNSLESDLESYIQVGEIIAELKKYAKSFEGSNFVVDRRSEKHE